VTELLAGGSKNWGYFKECGFHTVPMPFPCRFPAALIHSCYVASLPFSDNAVSFMEARVVDGNIRIASLLLVTTLVELRVVAGINRIRTGRPNAVSRTADANSHTPCRSHGAVMPRCAAVLRSRFQNIMVVAWQGNGLGTTWHV
jgi:hypothetical protein